MLRNLVLGRIAGALRDADLRRRGGDVGGALVALDVALADAREARARLVAQADAHRAETLDEPLALLTGTRALVARAAQSGRAGAD